MQESERPPPVRTPGRMPGDVPIDYRVVDWHSEAHR